MRLCLDKDRNRPAASDLLQHAFIMVSGSHLGSTKSSICNVGGMTKSLRSLE